MYSPGPGSPVDLPECRCLESGRVFASGSRAVCTGTMEFAAATHTDECRPRRFHVVLGETDDLKLHSPHAAGGVKVAAVQVTGGDLALGRLALFLCLSLASIRSLSSMLTITLVSEPHLP